MGGTDFEDVYLRQIQLDPAQHLLEPDEHLDYGSAKQYVPEIPWNDACASALIANYATGSFNTYWRQRHRFVQHQLPKRHHQLPDRRRRQRWRE